jgi:hypothetical protein
MRQLVFGGSGSQIGAEGDSLILLRLKDLLYGMIGTFTIKKLDVPI